MSRFLFISSSLIALAACTQDPALVELRGQENFSKTPRSFASAPVSSYKGAQPVYNAARERDAQIAASAPTQQMARTESISVSDLEPAAGGSQPVASDPAAPAPAARSSLVWKAGPGAAAESPPAKEVKLSSADGPAPVNPWTKKPRGNSAFDAPVAAKSATFIWPVASHEVTSSFGAKGKGTIHDGISISAQEGEPVWASADGEVVYADSKMKGYGKMIIVKHASGKTTTYAHLARMGVEKYDRVKQGDIIGYVGSTGNVKTPQLYFSMRDGTQAIDPQKYLDRKVAGL